LDYKKALAVFIILIVNIGLATALERIHIDMDTNRTMSKLEFNKEIKMVKPTKITKTEEPGHVNYLPAGVYSLSVNLEKDRADGDIDFMNMLMQNAATNRDIGSDCTGEPILSKLFFYKSPKVCLENIKPFPVIWRVFALQDQSQFDSSQVLGNEEFCFEADRHETYLVDEYDCADQCLCSGFTNQRCEVRDGHLQMLRTRNCAPDNCNTEGIWVDWVDTSVEGCDLVLQGCRDTDAGLDYNNYGTLSYRGDNIRDVCQQEHILIEHYCGERGAMSVQIACDCEDGECNGAYYYNLPKGTWSYETVQLQEDDTICHLSGESILMRINNQTVADSCPDGTSCAPLGKNSLCLPEDVTEVSVSSFSTFLNQITRWFNNGK